MNLIVNFIQSSYIKSSKSWPSRINDPIPKLIISTTAIKIKNPTRANKKREREKKSKVALRKIKSSNKSNEIDHETRNKDRSDEIAQVENKDRSRDRAPTTKAFGLCLKELRDPQK